MKLLLLFLGVVGLGLPRLAIPTAWAESRTPAEATAHALDELANCHAQRRPECPTETATPTPTVTWTPSAIATSTPQPPDTPTPTPVTTVMLEPCWLTDENGIVFDLDGAPVPCLLEGVREATVDAPEPTLEPTPTDRPTQVPPAPMAQQLPAAAPRDVIVVQTVIVTAQPVDTATPIPTTPMPTVALVRVVVETPPTPAVAPTPPHPTSTAQPPTSTPSARATVAVVSASAAPRVSVNRPAERTWLYVSVLACLALTAAAAAWLVYRGRRRFAP